MNKYLTSSIGRLRLLGFLEGTSLLVLVFIAVPFKYFLDNHSLVESIGPVHGVLFILFVINALHVGFLQQWKFTGTTMKVLFLLELFILTIKFCVRFIFQNKYKEHRIFCGFSA